MNDSEEASGRDRWARLRFAIVGPVLTAHSRMALRATLARLAARRCTCHRSSMRGLLSPVGRPSWPHTLE